MSDTRMCIFSYHYPSSKQMSVYYVHIRDNCTYFIFICQLPRTITFPLTAWFFVLAVEDIYGIFAFLWFEGLLARLFGNIRPVSHALEMHASYGSNKVTNANLSTPAIHSSINKVAFRTISWKRSTSRPYARRKFSNSKRANVGIFVWLMLCVSSNMTYHKDAVLIYIYTVLLD